MPNLLRNKSLMFGLVATVRVKNGLQWAAIGTLKILYEFIDLILAVILIGAVYHFFC